MLYKPAIGERCWIYKHHSKKLIGCKAIILKRISHFGLLVWVDWNPYEQFGLFEIMLNETQIMSTSRFRFRAREWYNKNLLINRYLV